MSITHELRMYACMVARAWKEDGEELTKIADRIDSELAERYVSLPLDADGVPIHVGDKLKDDAMRKSDGEVHRLMLENDGWYVGFSSGGWTLTRLHEWHHQKPDTWEQIIDDAEALAREWFNTDMSENEHAVGLDALVARCKALCECTKEVDE